VSRPEPKVDPRRAEALFRELLGRANTWVPSWRSSGSGPDFGHALLSIAARLGSEATERLDRVPTKLALGLLDWLGIGRQAGQAARMPLVFKLAKGVTDPPLAKAPVRIQANVGDTPVAFETQKDIQLVPSPILQVVGVDPARDAIYLPPAEILSLDPPSAGPSEWRLKSFAAAGNDKIQLSPPLGLALDAVVSVGGLEYRIATELTGDIAKVKPPLGGDVPEGAALRAVRNFAPFDGTSRNRQAHELYLGDDDALNLTAPACIALDGGAGLPEGVAWEYWGKLGDADPTWQPLERLGAVNSTLLLKKSDAGSVEILPVAGQASRWIRARQTASLVSSASFNRLSIRINCSGGLPTGTGSLSANCLPPVDPTLMPKLEGVANNTSLVLNDRFYPFGKIPRQFDAFYLACPEVFSKAAADASLHFTMADPTLGPLVVIRMGNGSSRVFGVANDGALHHYVLSTTPEQRLDYRGPLRPSTNAASGPANQPVFAEGDVKMPPALIVRAQNFSLVVWSGKQVWIYGQQTDDPAPQGAWDYFGTVGDPAGSQEIVQIVALGQSTLVAVVNDGSLHYCNMSAGPVWRLLDAGPGEAGTGPQWMRATAIQDLTTGELGSSLAKVFFAVAGDGRLSRFVFNQGAWVHADNLNQGGWADDFTPLAVLTVGTLLIAGKKPRALSTDPDVLHALRYSPPPAGLDTLAGIGNPDSHIDPVETQGNLLGAEFGWTIDFPSFEAWDQADEFATLYLLTTVVPQGGTTARLAWWTPLDADPEASGTLVNDPNPAGAVGRLAQNPVLAGDRVVVPGPSRDVLVGNFVPLQRTLLPFSPSSMKDGMTTGENLAATDFIALDNAPISAVGPSIALANNRFLYFPPVDLQGSTGTVYPAPANSNRYAARRVLNNITGTLFVNRLELVGPHEVFDVNRSVLLLVDDNGGTAEYSAHTVTQQVSATIVIVDGDLPTVDENTPLHYHLYDTAQVGGTVFPQTRSFTYAVRPTLTFDPTAAPFDLIRRGQVLHFLDSRTVPRQQQVSEVVGAAYPSLALLESAWDTPPLPFLSPFSGLVLHLSIDTSQSNWTHYTGDVSSNPELSWEYWNGSGWWKIVSITDGTANLKQSGDLAFNVPDDLKPTDVLGRQSHWIRARLIGGDYGRETFETKTVTTSTNPLTQTQSVVVNTDNIRAPVVLTIGIRYSICVPVLPKHVLTFDSRSWREQSDANRTIGARVDAFVPIAERLRQMAANAAAPPSPASDCPPCPSSQPSTELASTSNAADPADSRAIYLVFAAKFQGGPIRLLFLLQDRDHDTSSPLVVEALRNNRFEPVLTEDDTRGLGESGVLTLNLDGPPTESELFGSAGFWLRLRPRDPTTASHWQPNILGAYANAVWAEATETQTMEILGSSDGSPGQRLVLARPPVLAESLELRVLEPLGEEEKEALGQSPGKVLDTVPGLPGSWVLWEEVVDPGDTGPDARVYGLDFASGEIVFGDGEHGAIPPAGRNAVVAFQYRHGGEAAANAVPPFAPLNLVSPIEGVEAAIAPGPAAGGSDPEDAATVRRFAASRLRHRGRAVTLKDLEDLALHFTPDIAQARAFASPQGVRLVVVVRGSNPDPSQALVRELRAYLLDRASPALARSGALLIDPAGRVLFRLRIVLTVASLDVTGSAGRAAKQAMQTLFDPAEGGYDGLGWRVGAAPKHDAVAARLLAINGLEGIAEIHFSLDGASAEADSIAVKADQLAWLLPDGTDIQFNIGKAQP